MSDIAVRKTEIQNIIRQGNAPLAEIYAREYLEAHPEDVDYKQQIEREFEMAYGFPENFRACELPHASVDPGKYLIIKAWGHGFWSEVHHLLSQLLVAELTHRTPIPLWGTNCIFRLKNTRNSISEFFQGFENPDLEKLCTEDGIYPPKWHGQNIYTENRQIFSGEYSKQSAQYFLSRTEPVLVSDFYTSLTSIKPWISEKSCYFGLSEDDIYKLLFEKFIQPTDAMQAKADDFYQRHMAQRNWIAVHMRGSDKIHESPGLQKTNAHYFGFIDRMLELNPGIGIFLMTDAVQILEYFQIKYGERVLFTPSERTSSQIGVHLSTNDGHKAGQEVLIDALIALKCDYFIGNKESNVSLAIANMKRWPNGFSFLLGNEIMHYSDRLILQM